MKWAKPKRVMQSNEASRPEEAYADFNASIDEVGAGGVALEPAMSVECQQDALDVQEAKRRLSDPKDGTIDFDDFKRELGL